MRKFLVVFFALAAFALPAETNIIDGVKYVCEGGICRIVDDEEEAAVAPTSVNDQTVINGQHSGASTCRMAQGYMDAETFLSFLQDDNGPTAIWMTTPDMSGWMLVVGLLAVLLGGLAMNLTPCVLPMIPINLMIIGKSASRGAWYGLGIMIAYGTLGVLAAVGGLAFGSIQSSPWFNLGVAVVFVALALSLFGVFFIDFSKSRSKFHGGAFVMGMLAAVLAGACVAPILIAVLLWTAKQFAAGNCIALGMPFVLGLGMALPWPFVGAGLSVLPKPGAWMKWVNRGFGIVVLGFAFWYGRLAWNGFSRESCERCPSTATAFREATPATFPALLATLQSPTAKPVLVDCWATWCKNCTAMEKTTLQDPKVRQELENFTVVRLQAEDINALKKLSGFEGVMGLPAFVIFK